MNSDKKTLWVLAWMGNPRAEYINEECGALTSRLGLDGSQAPWELWDCGQITSLRCASVSLSDIDKAYSH